MDSFPASSVESARVVSVNVATPRIVRVGDTEVPTSIFKSPVEGRIAVKGNNLVGDRQADLTVHGGPHKAIYLYPAEHYAYWTAQLGGAVLPPGVFGENLTTLGIDENSVRIGDRFRIGSVVLQVTQPRMPCYKLAVRFGRADMVKRFWLARRPGIYFAVVEEGDLAAGDLITKVCEGPEPITVGDVVRLYVGEDREPDHLQRALRAPLPGGWKDQLRERASELARS
ncbi:MAG TPA: MOSC domain-containing protein [Bryobacteraceae bacterium]|nr:MOSC domain-containing protein [Bryobacteraceae bacterium]